MPDTKMVIKLLYKLFPEAFHKAVFASQSKPKNFSKCEFQFVDSKGRKYYKFMSDLDMPLSRKSMIELKLRELSYALDKEEVALLCEAMEKALERRDKQGRINPDIATLGFLIKEVRNRHENLLHPELIISMVAYIYIREDEDPAIVDEEIHNQKVEQFKNDGAGGLSDFFYTTMLSAYSPYSDTSVNELKLLLRVQKARVEAMKKKLIDYISGEE